MTTATKPHVRVQFAGLDFAGVQHGPTHVTVSVTILRRLLCERRVSVHLAYDIEHDGDGTRDRFNHRVDEDRLADWCDRELERLANYPRRPWLLYFDRSQNVIEYCPHCNTSYTLHPHLPTA